MEPPTLSQRRRNLQHSAWSVGAGFYPARIPPEPPHHFPGAQIQRKGAPTYDFLGEMVYRPQRNVAAPCAHLADLTPPPAHRNPCAPVPRHERRADEKWQALSCWLHLVPSWGANTHTDTKINSKFPAFRHISLHRLAWPKDPPASCAEAPSGASAVCGTWAIFFTTFLPHGHTFI